MTDALLSAFSLLLVILCLLGGRRWASVFVWFFVVWAVIFALRATLPIGQVPTSGGAAAVLAVGLGGVLAGLLAGSPWLLGRSAGSAVPDLVEHVRPHRADETRRLLVAGGVVLLAVLVGLVTYRSTIESRAGSEFDALTRQQVLYYQIYDSSGSSPAVLLLSLASVLAAIGVVLGRRHPAGYLVTVAAFACSVQDPSRTATISAVGMALIVYLALRPGRSGGAISWRVPVLIAAIAAVAVVYFNIEAKALDKTVDTPVGLPPSLSFLADPLVYATGSPSALSVAMTLPGSVPPDTDPLRSVWLLPRLASVVDPAVVVPNPVAGFVDMPQSYNTFTMFGDLYFDFGLVGVALGSVLLGLLAGLARSKVVARREPVVAWVSAVLTVILFAGTTGYHLFWLDTATWLVAGVLVFGWATRVRTVDSDSVASPSRV